MEFISKILEKRSYIFAAFIASISCLLLQKFVEPDFVPAQSYWIAVVVAIFSFSVMFYDLVPHIAIWSLNVKSWIIGLYLTEDEKNFIVGFVKRFGTGQVDLRETNLSASEMVQLSLLLNKLCKKGFVKRGLFDSNLYWLTNKGQKIAIKLMKSVTRRAQ